MSKFFKSMFLLLTAGLFTATGWAAEPTAAWSASFNGNTTCSGLFSGWSGDGDIAAESYVTTPNGSGFIAGTYAPWCDNSGITVANSFAFAVYADLSTVAPNSTIMGVGGAARDGGSGFTLAKTAKDEVAVVRYGATDTVIARLKSDTIKTSSFMLYTVSIIQNENSTVVTMTAGQEVVTSDDTTKYTPTGDGLRVGACYGDTAYVQIDGVNTTKAANAIIDEVRAYSRDLTVEDIIQLLEVFPTVKRPEVIAINFANNAADLGSSGLPTDAIGFEKVVEGVTYGGKVVPAFWTKTTGGVSNGWLGVVSTIERQYRLKWSSNANTHQSGNRGTLTEKLTYGYLDNGVNTQNHIELRGLPITGYDVAVILGGDGPNSGQAEKKKFSPVKVNGVNYTYDAGNNLIEGTTAWGVRAGANVLTEGTNVIFVPNQSLPTLSIDTYYQTTAGNAGRGTIAAIQVFIHSGETSPMFPPFGEATSYWGFEKTIEDCNKGVTSWTGDTNATNAYVDSYRKSERGIVYKGAQMSASLHPYWTDYVWPSEFTIMAYVNVAKCPNDGVLVSSSGNTKLRKVDSTTIRFGGPNVYVDAECADLAVGYHLIIATFGNAGLTLQIDNGQVARNASKSTIANGIQIGAEWAGGTHSYNNDGGAVIDDLAIWNKVLTSDEMDLLKACYPATYPTLSMAADTNQDNVISKAELDAAVGAAGVTKWNVSGEVVISLDADVSPALTALTLNPVNASGDSLTITGTGSLYGDGSTFALTTAIPVDITNQKNNPTITLSGAGDVTIRKGNGPNAGGIAPVANNYTGTFTVDDGQQITCMGGNLTIPFTVGAHGAKLHSNNNNWTVTSTISGSGTLTIESPNRWIAVTNNNNDFTGNVVVNSGIFYVGNKGSENSGSDARLGNENSTYTVKSGATFYTHLGGNNKTFAPNITLEEGATFGNRDGHVTYNGDITINGNAAYNFYWNKQNTFAGVVSGTGTLTINGPDNEDGTCEIRLTNAGNTFTGTYELAGKRDNRKIKLVACATTGAASYNLTNAYSILAFSGNVTANTLTGSAGSVESNASGTARTVTLTGNSDVRSLTVSNDITFAVTAGETYITRTTKATVADGAKVKVVLTADQKLSGLTLENVTVNDGGTVVFLDINGTTELQSSGSNVYEAAQTATYTVTAEGGSWNKVPENGDAITIVFGEIADRTLDVTILPEGVTHLMGLTTTGANASVTAAFAAIADAVIIEDALSIVGTEEETTVAGVISGDGQVKIVAGQVKFTNTNTYTGGTNIATDATLIMGNANAIGTTGAITGAGTLKFSGFIPANLSNITVADGGWTGTFYMMNRLSAAQFPVNNWGNAKSTVCFENCSGYLTPEGGTTVVPNIRVEGDGWRSQDGNGNAQFTFTGALSGSGKLEVATATPVAGNFYKFTGAVSGFTGYVNVTNNHRVVFGDANSQGNGKITIAKNVTIAAKKTWSAVNGIAIMEGATLTVNGAITGAIANAGTLMYGVDTTASNTFTGAGAIQVAAEKTVDLRSATLTSFTGSYSVGEGATLKLPLAATANKEIALGTNAKLLVVLNDEQKGEEQSVTVTGGSVQFVDANDNVLCDDASYTAPIYTVGAGWTGANRFAGANIVIDFAETTGEAVDLATILDGVTALSKLTVKGTNGGTITDTNSTVTACPTLNVQASLQLPIELVNLCANLTVAADKTLTIDVAQEATLNKALSGNYTVKKSGAGTLTLGANVNVDGGVEILAGTLKFGDGVIPYNTGNDYPTTKAGDVKVHTDATLDVNGKGDAFLKMVTLCRGATYANSSSTELGSSTRQLKGITLEGDATVHANAHFGILASGHADSTLNLRGYTLTKTGSGTFWLSKTAVSNGTLKVDEGNFEGLNNPTFSNVTFDSNSNTAFTLGTGAVTAPVTKKGTGALTIAGNISGDGAVMVTAGTLNLSGANGGYIGTITIEKYAVLASSGEASIPFTKGVIVNNGTVKIYNGHLPPTSGTGDVIFGDGANIAAELTAKGTITIPRNATVNFARGRAVDAPDPDFSTNTPSINGGDLIVLGTLGVGSDAGEPTVTIAKGKSLSGSGTITDVNTFTLDNGATIDATDGVVKVTGAVTLPTAEGETVKVKVAKYGDVLKATGLNATKFTLADGQLNGQFVATADALVYAPRIQPAAGEPAIADTVMAEVARAAGANGVTTVTAVKPAVIVDENDKPILTVDVNGAELFNNVISFENDANSGIENAKIATVSYLFGVSDITVVNLANAVENGKLSAGTQYVAVCAKVSNATGGSANTADYATGIALKLLNEDNEDAEVSDVVEPTADELAALRLTAAAGERWLAVPMETLFPVNQETGAATTGTMKLKVQATNTTP